MKIAIDLANIDIGNNGIESIILQVDILVYPSVTTS